MASLFKRPNSPFWFCSYRAGDGRWLKKSTKQTDRRKAIEFCRRLEEAERAALSRTLTTAKPESSSTRSWSGLVTNRWRISLEAKGCDGRIEYQ